MRELSGKLLGIDGNIVFLFCYFQRRYPFRLHQSDGKLRDRNRELFFVGTLPFLVVQSTSWLLREYLMQSKHWPNVFCKCLLTPWRLSFWNAKFLSKWHIYIYLYRIAVIHLFIGQSPWKSSPRNDKRPRLVPRVFLLWF